MIMSVLLLGIIALFFNSNNFKISNIYGRNLKRNIEVHFLSILLIFSTLIASIKYGMITFTGLIIVISTILSLYVFYLFIPILIYSDLDNKTQKLIKFITFFSLVSIVIGIQGSFLGYNPTHYKRIASIFFDPNYFGTIASIGFILSINRKGKYKIYALLNMLALYFSGSRAAMIALIFVMIIFFFYNKKIRSKTIFKFLLLGIITYFAIGFLADINFFRIYHGLSSRDYLWRLSFELILNEPIWGYGYGSVADLIRSMGAQNASSHNSYLDYIIMYGIPAFVINVFIILKATFLGIKNKLPQEITKSILFLLIVANSISINLGGLGVLSLLLTLFLGLSNMASCGNMYELNAKDDPPKTLEKSEEL
ncbi:O-antigen ligase family protein [Alkalithermobacter paradoxus]